MIDARVVALFTATVAGEPVTSHEDVELVAGAGIRGDRYFTKCGYWSDDRWPDQELTLVEAEAAEALGVEAGELRRNVVTRGVRLNDLIGVRFRIGDAVLEGVRSCDPCAYIESRTRPGLLRALAGRGGLRARIVTSGHIRVGDAIEVLAGVSS